MQVTMALAVAIAACLALLIPVSYAAVSHTVGDSTGWTTPPSPSFYSSWASKQSSFNVGDFLVFNYSGSTETVAEVTKPAYDSCSALNPITQVNNGPVNVTITSPGPHYYISTDPGHCSAGQKFFITAASPNIPPPTTPAAPAPKSTTTPPATPTTPSGSKSPAASTPTPTPTGKGGAMTPSTTPSPPSGAMTPATTPTATPTGKGGAMTPSTTPSPPSGAMTPATTPTATPGSSTPMSPTTSPMVAPESSPMSPTGAPSSTISSSPATSPSAPAPSMDADAPMAGGPESGGPTASSTPAAADGGMKTPAEAPAATGSASATRIAALMLLPVLLVITPNFLF